MEKNWLLPSLKEMSLCKLAQETFSHQVNTDLTSEESMFCFSTCESRDDACNLVKDASWIPRSIKNLLEEKIKFISREIDLWMERFSSSIQVPSYSTLKSMLFLPLVVWTSDGFIDYERTARNLILDPRLTLVQKYTMACSYCMEDEIKHFWATNSSELNFDELMKSQYVMLIYWDGIRRNHYHETLLRGSPVVEINLLGQLHQNICAIQYFWNLLSREDQLSHINLCQNPKVLTCWLRSLKQTDLQMVLAESFGSILYIYTSHSSYGKYIYHMWTMIKDFISGSDFSTLLIHLKRSINASVQDLKLTTSLLIDIWNSSSDQLKSYTFQSNSGACIYSVCGVLHRDMERQTERDDRFVQVILSDASPEFYEKFFQNECVKFLAELTV